MAIVKTENDSTLRVSTPQWLTDTDIPAPCFCGRPFVHGDGVFLIESDGLKRLVHMECMPSDMMFDDDDSE